MCHFIVDSLRAAWIGVGVAIVVAGDGVARTLCAADRGSGEASIGAGVKDTEALVEDADCVVHVGRVVCCVVAPASGKASLKIDSIRAVGRVVSYSSGSCAPGKGCGRKEKKEKGEHGDAKLKDFLRRLD